MSIVVQLTGKHWSYSVTVYLLRGPDQWTQQTAICKEAYPSSFITVPFIDNTKVVFCFNYFIIIMISIKELYLKLH